MLQFLGIESWLLILGSVFFYQLAQPEQETFLDRRWHKTVRQTANTDQIALSLKFLQVNLILCAGGFMINLLHKAAYGRHFNRSLILVGALTVLAMYKLHGQIFLFS